MYDRTRTINRADAVLVVVDIQERLAAAMPHKDDVIETATFLVRACDAMGVPVIVTRQYVAGLGDTVSELADVLGNREPIDKLTFSCMGTPEFREAISKPGRRQVLLAGMETHVCVSQTALDLMGAGYEVSVLADGVCSRRSHDHEIAVRRLATVGASVTVAESVIYEMLGVAGTPEFKQVLELVKARPVCR